MLRLGFAVRALGRPGLRSHDPQRAAHLSIGLTHLGDMLTYLEQTAIRYYRLSGDLLPSDGTGHAQVAECQEALDMLAQRLARANTRLTLHLDASVALGNPDNALAAAGLARIEELAALLGQLDAHRAAGIPESALIVHLGGTAGEAATFTRFAARYRALSPAAQQLLAVEHDGAGCSLGQLLMLHERCGVAVVFDALHWQLNNPERIPLDIALGLALATWPRGRRAEIHLSSARSEAHIVAKRASEPARVLPPRPGQHADFVNVADLIRLLQAAQGLPPFDLMLEAKAGDLALFRLRDELHRHAPVLASLLS
ncbi:UV damage endonuclease UvsE [Candidatus Gracilibacteria bacterium]|nr:UV damage endonuclease UvsE [Candidatus Gracilibacteria bacterium]